MVLSLFLPIGRLLRSAGNTALSSSAFWSIIIFRNTDSSQNTIACIVHLNLNQLLVHIVAPS